MGRDELSEQGLFQASRLKRVSIRRPSNADAALFLAAARRSSRLHRPWVTCPRTTTAVRKFLNRSPDNRRTFLVWYGATDLVGVINVSEIVRGPFQSAYLGYYAFEPLAGQGLMREGLRQVIDRAFTSLKLHRLEANIQPQNVRSKRLVQSLGFKLEGYSPRYLKVAGRWRDHERWTVLSEEWRKRRSRH